MAMPKTTVHEDSNASARQYDVWSPRKTLRVKPIAKTLRVQRAPDLHLGFRITTPNARHLGAAF
jgi:hypothetical protein